MSLRIGVDGGGTKTELILVDAAGTVIARQTAAGCNPSQVGPEAARTVLIAALSELRGGREISRTMLFMAGSPAFWGETAAGLAGFGRVTNAPDSVPIVELATEGRPGLVLHSGTGSFAAARTAEGAVRYAGGLGWKLGDPGSAFDVGRRGIARALLELQGWAHPSGLGAALQTHLGLPDAAGLTRRLYNEPSANADIARFAPRVVELAAQGCGPARAELHASLAGLVDQAQLLQARLFPGSAVPCGVSGALLNSAPAVAGLRALAGDRAWTVEFHFVTAPPIEGVRRLLLAAG